MLFSGDNYEKVWSGRKTQTRRLVKFSGLGLDQDGEIFLVSIETRKGPRVKWRVGDYYAVQPGRGKPSGGRIRLLGIRYELLQAISEGDAKAEGVESRAEFAALWNRINERRGSTWERNPWVFVLIFEAERE